MMTNAENTETTIAEVVTEPAKDSQSEEISAVDLAQVLEEAMPVQITEAQIVKVKPLEAPKYVDPIEQEYFTQRNNHIETPESRTSKEGIAMIHESLHFTGDQPHT